MNQFPQEKINSVINLARHWIVTMPDKPPAQAGGPRETWDGLQHLLQEFSDFTTQYAKLLQKAPLNNPRFVMSQGADHLLQDFNILSRACEQRKDKTTSDGFAFHLAEAEVILERYCNRWSPGESAKFVKLKTPVVYFEKLYGITRSIYSPEIPIIAIPLSEYNRSDNWQALSHEFGHHIYWNALESVADFEEFQHKLQDAVMVVLSSNQDSRNIWISWLEEIFADIFGTLLEGPRFAIACQDFAMERIRDVDNFVKDDHEHPALFLRPLIAIQVLHEIGARIKNDEFDILTSNIEQRWRTFCGNAVPLTLHNSEIKVADLCAQLVSVVRVILDGTYWPEQSCLWNLLQFFGSEDVTLPLLDLNDTSPLLQERPEPIAVPQDEDIPVRLKEIWEYLNTQEAKRGITYQGNSDTEVLAHWNILLDIGLNESHQHANAHAYCDRHFYYWPLHKHDPASFSSVSC